MSVIFYILLTLLVLCTHLGLSENVEDRKQVKTRAAYNYGGHGDPNRFENALLINSLY